MHPLLRTPLLALLCLTVAACGQTRSPQEPGPRPVDASLRGTVHAPAGGDVAGTLVVACVPVGDDCDEDRSVFVEVAASGSSAPFALADLEAIPYELYAIHDVDGDDLFGEGDHFGGLPATVTPPRSGLELRMEVLSEPVDPVDPVDPTDPPVRSSRFFVFSGDDVRTTTDPAVEVDARGRVHMVFPAYAAGDAFYATCAGDCADAAAMTVVRLPTTGTVDNAMIALGADGRPHALLSTYARVYYASCTGDCRGESDWRVDVALEHGGEFEVSGEAFALDPQGRPRFLAHPYRSLAPVGGADPAALLVACDAGCTAAANWRSAPVASQLWQESTLRYAADGGAHVATVVAIDGAGDAAAYLTCASDCENENGWNGVALLQAFSDPYVAGIRPAVALALTADGRPRLLALGDDSAGGAGGRTLVYLSCDAGCSDAANWSSNALIAGAAGDALGAGLDLALDASGAPRLAYTADANILLASCDADCALGGDEAWSLSAVELSADLPADGVIPYHNCTVSAWFLSRPSLAVGADGAVRVGYRAEDVSGNYGPVDPNHPPCSTGADMTLTRFAQIVALGN